MPKPSTLKGLERSQLLDELYKKYALSHNWKTRFVYWRKKYFWLFVVQGAKIFKRIVDIILSSILLIVLSPLLLLIALAVKISDGGPVLYVSNRVGKWGQEFRCPKFRTMYPGAEKLKDSLKDQSLYKDDITFKIKEDPRRTPIGKILRKTSLDELPQLWTVLKGDMSMVGPRPPLPEEVASYTLEERRRLDVLPGLTCIWQVSGRSDLSFANQVALDLQYIESQSFWVDFKLLLKTIPAVIFGRGAY